MYLRHSAAVVVIGALLFSAASFVHAQSWQGKEELRDNVLHVLNPATPVHESIVVKPRELFRLGGDSDDEHEMFGRIIQVEVDDAGRTYLLDLQLQEIKVFDVAGTFVRTYGRSGEGPGEYSYPLSMFFLPGDRLAVSNLIPCRVPTRDLTTGNARDDLTVPSHEGSKPMFVETMDAWQDNIVLGYVHAFNHDGREANMRILASFREGDRELGILDKRMIYLADNPPEHERESFFNNWAIGADGTVYVAPYYLEDQLFGFNLDGSVRHIIEREYETLKRTGAEMKELNADHERRYGGIPGLRKPTIYHRHIEEIFPRANGELWVLTQRGIKAVGGHDLGRFDVFDTDGRFVRQVTLDVEFDSRWDEFEFAGDRLYVHRESRSIPGTTGTMPGGGMFIVAGHEATSADDHDAKPYELVCYEVLR